jgi:hypothetical protein
MPKKIFHRSRRVLDDCKIALDKFNEEPSDIEFRLTLVTCISLLRLVGHVIKSEASELGLSDQNHQLWEQEKSSDIFSQFINHFRNNILKEYKSPVGWSSITSENGHRMEYKVLDGFFKDRDIRDLIQDGINWWELYLAKLEVQLSK